MEFLEVPLFDDDLFKLIVRFLMNAVSVGLVVGFCYYRHQKNKNYVFTFLLINVMIFFICFSLKKLDLGLGMALGLFAIFGIIRYRTDAIQVKEMTYLFIVVGLAVINALSNKKTSYAELLLVNVVVFATAMILERFFMLNKTPKQKTPSTRIVYENIELLANDRREELVTDLRHRTGLEITKVKVTRVDFSKGVGTLVVNYLPENHGHTDNPKQKK